MAVFTYTAIDDGEAVVSGTIAADTPRQAREQLRSRGLLVQAIRARRAGVMWLRLAGWRRSGRVQRHKTVQFVREMATLLGIGVPMLEALDTIARQHRGPYLAVILQLRERVAAGISLAQAMREQPDVFDEITVNMTETGEDAGTLDAIFERLAEFRERQAQLRGSIGTALIYPGIVLCMAVLVTMLLMSFVVPRIIDPLLEQGQELPTITIIVKGLSDLLLGWWWLLLLIVIAGVAAVSAALRTERGQWAWHRTVLRLPLIGDLVRKHAIVRIAVAISTLIKSGVEFVRALQIAQRSTRNLVIRDALARCEKAVSAGGEIAAGLEQTQAFPPLVVQVFSIGQQSGRLEEMLDRLARDYDAQVALVAQRVAAILEPLLIIILAAIVLCIIMATLLPILEMGNVVQ
jgi:type II secretory pathway component PulF